MVQWQWRCKPRSLRHFRAALRHRLYTHAGAAMPLVERNRSMAADPSPLDDMRDLLSRLPAPDSDAGAQTLAAFLRAAQRQGRMGRIEEIAAWLSRWSGRSPPQVMRPLVAIFAGNHGIAVHGVSRHPVSATAEMVELIAAGGAAVSQACVANDLGLKVFDLALHLPTGDITREAAFDARACMATMAFGMEATAGNTDLLCLSAVLGGAAADWVGGERDCPDGPTRKRRIAAVEAVLAAHGAHLRDPLQALQYIGGREMAAIAGAIVAARVQKVPVLLDGTATLAAAAVLKAASPTALDHCLLAAIPVDTGAARAAEMLNLRPLLDLEMRDGLATNAALAAGMVRTAARIAAGTAEAFPAR
jgi:nicotinate-nucleotide--dimethylbenzimidazole phosphoribosyltransferase